MDWKLQVLSSRFVLFTCVFSDLSTALLQWHWTLIEQHTLEPVDATVPANRGAHLFRHVSSVAKHVGFQTGRMLLLCYNSQRNAVSLEGASRLL